MKLTEKSSEVLNYVRDNGGKVAIDEICAALGRPSRSVGANVTDLAKKQLAVRVKEAAGEKEITYVELTAEGKAFVPTEE